MMLSKKDVLATLTTGLTTGLIAWRVLAYLGTEVVAGVLPTFSLVGIIPVLWLIGVEIGYILGRWIAFFNQFGRFAAVGFTNAAVDFGVLYLFIAYSNITAGVYFTVFKTVSFIVALIHSYFWNRTWSFDQKIDANGKEFIHFTIVAVASLIVNVTIASLVANAPHLGTADKVWAGIAAIVGSAASLFLSFAGYKLIVFKR